MNRGMIAGLVLGIALGLLGGHMLFRRDPVPASIPGREEPRAANRGSTEEDEVAPDVNPAPKDEDPAEAEEPTPAVLEGRVQSLAKDIRARGRQMVDQAEESARAIVRREVERERARREDLARDGTMAWLRGLERKFVAPFEMLSSPEIFGRLFDRKTEGRAIDASSFVDGTVLSDGDVIVFAAGRHALDTRRVNRIRPFPKDILVLGQGMNETLVLMNDEFRLRGDVHSLTFRDLTLHCGDNYLESMRNGPYTLRIERCRIIGFDMGAGGSSMLSGGVGAFYASDSRIEAGFGRAPGFGNLFDVRGAFVARLENCDIVGPFSSVIRGSSREAQVFERCRFTNLRRGSRTFFDRATKSVRFVECSFHELPEGALTHPKKRSLAELNPSWE